MKSTEPRTGAPTLGELEQVVLLAALRLGGEGYGVTIRETIRDATGRDLTMGTIHKTLVRLEAKGMLASRMGESSPVRGGRARRYYRVSASGLKAVRASMRAIRRLAHGLSLDPEAS